MKGQVEKYKDEMSCATGKLSEIDIEMITRNIFRDRHALVSVAGNLYAVGGSRSIGSERSIEMFDGTQWQEIAQTNGFR